ncbi:MAG: four helix bundle protein [Phycisphaerales bacterium]|nr:MAG: four helix bundle protein [Phycisphaerales bacterium]
MRSFEDLTAWQLSMACCVGVYKASESFPSDERFGLVSQVRRAAVSVPSNIAEGYGRGSRQDYARFLRVARGSMNEVETQLIIAVRLGYLSDEMYREVRNQYAEAGRVLAGLIRSIES